jgi:dTDP-4-amino-4,6-dideoxygalactose transaminase
MRVPFADLSRQHLALKREIDAAIAGVIERSSFIMGPEVSTFEDEFAHFCGVKHAVGVSNGTEALVLALRALGIGPGHEVITVPNSFIATSEAVTAVGATVRFVDVDPKTYTIDVEKLEAAVTPRTGAVIPVHLYGQAANMDAVLEVSRRHHLKVVEDAAQAHGARWNGRKVGGFGDCACFSFYPGKNLGAFGDAGAVVTNDSEIAGRIARLRNHGRDPGSKYEHSQEGFNARIDSLQAAILSVKLRQLTDWNHRRRAVARAYFQQLGGCEEIGLPFTRPEAEHVFHLFVIQVEKREELQRFLKSEGVASGVHYPVPLHLQPAYTYLGLGPGSYPVTESLSNRIVSLPMFAEMTDAEVEYVTSKVLQFQRSFANV